MVKKIICFLVAIFVAAPACAEIIDNRDAGFTKSGAWYAASNSPGFYDRDYYYSKDVTSKAVWTFQVSNPGVYRLSAQWAVNANHSESVKYVIEIGGQKFESPIVSQRSGGGEFNHLGAYTLPAGTAEVTMTWAGGYVSADAVQLEADETQQVDETVSMPIHFSCTHDGERDGLRIYRKLGENVYSMVADIPNSAITIDMDGLYFSIPAMDYIIGETYLFAATAYKKYPDGAINPSGDVVREIESGLSNTVEKYISTLPQAQNVNSPYGFMEALD